MLHLLSELGPDSPTLPEALSDHQRSVGLGPRGDRELVARIEAEVRQNPEAHLRFDSTGLATLSAAGVSYRAGRFRLASLAELRTAARDAHEAAGRPSAKLSFYILDGASPATDIGALQAHAPPGSLFQVASQFNCLEAPDAFVTPIASYLHDPTQGPRASISAFPGTFVRHYAAPGDDGSRFVQVTDGPQLDLLSAFADSARVESGYLTTQSISDPERLARDLSAHRDRVRVGVHDGIEVVFGHDWDGPVPDAPDLTVAQVLTSSLAAGGYSRGDVGGAELDRIVSELQRAAHLGTLLSAASLGKTHVCLTMIGGGVFGNPHSVILDAILWALDEVRPLLRRDTLVALNGYHLGRSFDARTLARAASERNGALVHFEPGGVSVTRA
jgi:hypothetical protein